MARPSTQLHFELVGGVAHSAPRSFPNRRRRGIGLCESPIERQLAFAFSDIGGFRWSIPGDDPHEIGRWSQLALALLSQPDVGPLRPDFGVARIGWQPGQVPPLCIEVDGFEFHDLTRGQADRDRVRARYLVSRGAAVMRFSGREVHRNPDRCAAEVFSYCARSAHLFPVGAP